MNNKKESRNVGASVPAIAVIAIVVAVAVMVVGLVLYRTFSNEAVFRPIVIATGPQSGAYHELGLALARVLERNGSFSSVKIVTTDGSAQNMALIGEPESEVDFAFVQANASPSTNARLITSLYDEVMHIVVSSADAADISTIYDLEGADVSLGAEGSGTRELSLEILRHFGVRVASDRVMRPSEIPSALADETIDAAFTLTAIPSRLISALAELDRVRFLSLGESREAGDEAHALELVIPGVKRAMIPRSTYVRLPSDPVHTISVTAMLVARADIEEELVRAITEIIFGHRSGDAGLEGSDLVVARQIRENYNPAMTPIPYHPGAIAYYRREDPPFFVEYAEALSLVVSVLLGLFSVSIALREWLRRRMKNRVDAYLLEVERLASGIQSLGREALLQRRNELEALRRSAFEDLVSERVLSDEAFIILQNHLRDELAAVSALIEDSNARP